ncbi:MAG TPA: saccharopine dehydrogenase NADP-binding domain-containing protein [Pseudomonadales bacterium]|nr:saccharopine dehydrogenase NADP-binding domain-containing protein [Pseudomonadales bacterium]
MPLIVLILGGYGNFGSKIARRLAGCVDIRLIIAGRNLQRASRLSVELQTISAHAGHALRLDATDRNFEQALCSSGAQLLIHTSGPFQLQDYRVANACINNGIHYIDLADGRSFVAHFNQLADIARKKGVLAVTGASTVPGLSSAVICKYLAEFSRLEKIEYGISPGNKAERGEATVAAILSYTGHTFQRLENGTLRNVYGWQDIFRHKFPGPMGLRWLANCDVPDLALFPESYPTLKTIRFYAGLELPLLHLAMWVMSWLARFGLIRNWARYAASITQISRWFEGFGSDNGGMYMRMSGVGTTGDPLTVEWTLIAENGDGPMIPTIPAVILARKLACGRIDKRGAMPCMELFALDEFFAEVKDLSIYEVCKRNVYDQS